MGTASIALDDLTRGIEKRVWLQLNGGSFGENILGSFISSLSKKKGQPITNHGRVYIGITAIDFGMMQYGVSHYPAPYQPQNPPIFPPSYTSQPLPPPNQFPAQSSAMYPPQNNFNSQNYPPQLPTQSSSLYPQNNFNSQNYLSQPPQYSSQAPTQSSSLYPSQNNYNSQFPQQNTSQIFPQQQPPQYPPPLQNQSSSMYLPQNNYNSQYSSQIPTQQSSLYPSQNLNNNSIHDSFSCNLFILNYMNNNEINIHNIYYNLTINSK